MTAVQGLSMDFDEIKEEEGPKMEINELDVDEREKLVTIGVLDEVVERVKMEADEKSVEFRKRYDERMEALNNVIAQLFAMGKTEKERTDELEKSVKERLSTVEARTLHQSKALRTHGQEIQDLTDRHVRLVREVDALDTRLTSMELHRNVTEEVEEEEVVFEDGEEANSSSEEVKLNRTIVPDNDEHVTRRSSRNARSSVGTNAPGTVLDEAALRGEISHSAEKVDSGTGKKVRIGSGDYDPGGNDSDSSHRKTRKSKYGKKGRKDKKKRGKRHSKDSNASDSCSSSSSYSSPSTISDDSSDSSDSESDSSTSSAKGKRKAGTTAAYIGTLKKKYEFSSPRAALAKYGTPTNIRAEEAKIFGNAGRINLQAKPTLEDLSF